MPPRGGKSGEATRTIVGVASSGMRRIMGKKPFATTKVRQADDISKSQTKKATPQFLRLYTVEADRLNYSPSMVDK